MRRHLSLKSQTCTEGIYVYVAGISRKVSAHYPGRSLFLPKRLLSSGDDKMGTEKSAEVIVGGIDHHRRTESKFKGRNLNCIMEAVIGKRTEMFKSYNGSMGRNPGVKI